MRRNRKFGLCTLCGLILSALSGFISSCERVPELLLVDREVPIEIRTDRIVLDLNVLWDYEIIYDWRAEWHYGWDERDDSLFGTWDLIEPNVFNLRRYYTEDNPTGEHKNVLSDMVNGRRFLGNYKLGYYDLLVWNDVSTLDGVQSLHFDETTTLEYVTAYTNQASHSTTVPHYSPAYSKNYKAGYAFYQPEFLFSTEYRDLYVSDDPADYDSLVNMPDGTQVWYKYVPLELTPVTYIYLTQIILHNNEGRISGLDGSANLTGMARSVNLNTHITSEQDVSVNYPVRMKRNLSYTDNQTQKKEQVDIVGGRLLTFGITGTDPYKVTRASNSYQKVLDSQIPNYIEVNMSFFNGRDSTFVFDVTDQVKEHYKGGVITLHLDVDKIPIPSTGGSGHGGQFDAVVVDPEEETHEFEM